MNIKSYINLKKGARLERRGAYYFELVVGGKPTIVLISDRSEFGRTGYKVFYQNARLFQVTMKFATKREALAYLTRNAEALAADTYFAVNGLL